MVEQFLSRIALFGRSHYRMVFLIAGAVAVGCVLLTLSLDFDTDMLALLPKDEPLVNTFRDTMTEFGGVDRLLVLVGLPEGAATDPYQAFAAALGESLQTLEEIEYVDYRIGEMEELIASYLPNAFFLLDEEGRATFEKKLSDDGIRGRVEELRRLVTTPQSVAIKELIKLDPLGLSDAFVDRVVVSRGAVKVDLSTGFFLSNDRRLLLLSAKPTQPAQEIDFTRRLIEGVNEKIDSVLASWPEIAGADAPALPTVRLGGNYITVLDDDAYIRRDVVLNALTSMAGVLILFLFAFRRLGLLLYAFVPLSMGLLLTFAFTAATVGALNAASSAFAALLVGLGIDFIIVSYGRYVEERRAGRPLAEALGTMSGSSGRAVLLGAITSAATFYSFASTQFVGLRQMGYLTGTGILFCMLAVLFLLPAMLAWSDDHHGRRDRFPRLYLHGFGSSRLIRFSLRRPGIVLTAGAALTGAAAVLAFGLTFEDSIREMRPKGGEGSEIETEVGERFGSGFDFMMLVLSEDSLESVLELTDRAVRAVEQVVGGEEIVRFESIASILPPRSRQLETLEWLREHQGLVDPDRVRARFAAAASDEGLQLRPFLAGLDLFEQAASVDHPVTLADLSLDASSQRLLQRFVRKTDSGWKSIVYLYPPPRRWKRDPPPAAVALAEDLGSEAVLSGVNVVSAFLRESIKRDAIIAALVGLLVVSLLLWMDFKRPLDTLLCMAPLVVGIVWMLGAMVAFSLTMNFFNIFVTTMIIGIGVDYGIHMMHRYREVREAPLGELETALVETGKAVVLAALSTIVGFGSLSLSSYPGLRSMGIVAILGAISTAMVAITLLPAYLSLRMRRGGASGKRAQQ